MSSLRYCALILCLALTAAAEPAPPVPVQGPVRAQHLTVELLALQGSIEPGGTEQVGLHFTLDKGWHVYWINAGDSGEPPSIKWTLPAGITAGAMQFPAPRRLPLGPLMDFGYEDEVLFPITLSADSSLKAPSTALLGARVNWLVCREVCIPGKADLALPLQIAATQSPANPERQALFDRFNQRLPQPLPSSATAVFGATPTGYALALTGRPASSAEFFPLDQSQIANAAPQPVTQVDGGLEISLKKDENFHDQISQLNGVLVLGDGKAYAIHAPVGALPAAARVGGIAGGVTGLIRFAGLAFLGGLILNLMPCVFPVLFIKGLSLVESSRHHYSRVRAHGLVYALGILVSFWVVVALLLGLRAGGRQLGWGFQFQSPGFVAVMALLLFFLGLSLAGMFEIGLSVTSAGSSLASRHGYSGSFFTGVLAVVVATPCTAPFMGAAIGFALAQSAAVAFIIFTALGLGLAAPYVLLTFHPVWMRHLPRPGAWMEVLKQATAAPIFATVIWLVWIFASAAGVDALTSLLAAFLLLAIAGWILGRWPARRVASAFAISVIVLAVATPLYALWKFPAGDSSTSARAGNGHPGWQPYSKAAIEQYRAQGKPVFVDFTARWCLSCQVNERAVLNRDDVRRRLRDSGVVLVRADWTKHDEGIASALTELGRSGVPAYVFYLPGQPALVLPEVLTPGLVLGPLDQLQNHAQNSKLVQ